MIEHLSGLGIRLELDGDVIRATPKAAITDEARNLIRAHKPELLAALASGDVLRDAAAEARRQRVLAILAGNPAARHAVVTDMDADAGAVIVALAIRGQATCELRIPRDRYDGALLLDLIERHSGTVH